MGYLTKTLPLVVGAFMVSLNGAGCGQRRNNSSKFDATEKILAVRAESAKEAMADEDQNGEGRQSLGENRDLVRGGFLNIQSYAISHFTIPFECHSALERAVTGISSNFEMIPIFSAKGETIFSVCQRVHELCLQNQMCLLSWQPSDTTPRRILSLKGKRIVSGKPSYNWYYSDKEELEVCEWGYAAQGVCRDPYYSVAFDPAYHKLGDVIFVPKLKGMALPDRRKHSGFFILREPVLKGAGPDVFKFFARTYPQDHSLNPFSIWVDFHLDNKARVKFYEVTGETAEAVRVHRGYPYVQNSVEDQK